MRLNEEVEVIEFSSNFFEKTLNVFKYTMPKAFEDSEGILEQETLEHELASKKQLMELSLVEGSKEVIFFIARYNDKIIGVISYGKCSEAIKECTNNELAHLGEIGSLFVLPEYQGKGIASKLINTVIDYLKEKGIREFCLDSGYKQAQKKWLNKFGTPYKVVKDYWGPEIDNIIWLCKIDKR